MKNLIFLILISLSFLSCSSINKKLGLQNDNDFEEVLEEIIDAKTGLNVDLTPLDPEK